MALSQFLLRNTDLNDFTFCGQNNLMFSIVTTFSQHISIIYQVSRMLHFETCFYLKMKIVQCVMLMRVLSQHLKHIVKSLRNHNVFFRKLLLSLTEHNSALYLFLVEIKTFIVNARLH